MQTLDNKFYTPSRYGWVMVVVAAMAMVATMPGRTHGLGVLTERLLKDPAFSMTRVEFSDMNLWATLLGGLFCLPCGRLIDRYGLRITLTSVVVALGIVVLSMTQLTGNTALFTAILLTRGFGQSALSVLSITMVGKWFHGKATLPMAVYSLILSAGFAGAMQWAMGYSDAGWRSIWEKIGWVILLVMAPTALILTRDPPAERETAVSDMSSSDVGSERAPADSSSSGFTVLQAMTTPAFWTFGLAISYMAVVTSGMSLFNESVVTSQGLEKEAFCKLASLSFLVGLFVQLPAGWLGQRVSLSRFQTVALVMQAGCLMWLPHVHTQTQLVLYGIGMGIGGTISTVIFYSIWGQAFGRSHLGKIQGVAQMMTVLASSLGPKLLAECQARTGDYRLIFEWLAIAGFGLAIASWLVRVPGPEDAAKLKSSSTNDLSAEAAAENLA